MNKITACLDCTSRTLGCHSKCKRYLAQKTILELKKKRMQEAKRNDAEIMNYLASDRGNIKKSRKK